jgi:hypothetical protein
MEETRQLYWKLYLGNISKFVCELTKLHEYKVRNKLLSFNTFLIGFYKYNFIFMPPVAAIKKHQNLLRDDIEHNYKLSDNEFDLIIHKIIELRDKFTKLGKLDKNNYHIEVKLPDYKHMKKSYTGDDIKSSVRQLVLRYEYYGDSRHGICLSLDQIYKWCKGGLEMFAGAINSNLPDYCSLFPDLEHEFGSKGSVFQYKGITKFDLLVCNPPYYNNVMTEAAKLIVKYFKKVKNGMAIMVVPDWRSESQYDEEQIKISELPQKRQKIIYPCYEILRNSDYYRNTILIGNYKFKNYFDSSGSNYSQIRDNIIIVILTSLEDDVRIKKFIKFINSTLRH